MSGSSAWADWRKTSNNSTNFERHRVVSMGGSRRCYRSACNDFMILSSKRAALLSPFGTAAKKHNVKSETKPRPPTIGGITDVNIT